jgi:hypothetical protein
MHRLVRSLAVVLMVAFGADAVLAASPPPGSSETPTAPLTATTRDDTATRTLSGRWRMTLWR